MGEAKKRIITASTPHAAGSSILSHRCTANSVFNHSDAGCQSCHDGGRQNDLKCRHPWCHDRATATSLTVVFTAIFRLCITTCLKRTGQDGPCILTDCLRGGPRWSSGCSSKVIIFNSHNRLSHCKIDAHKGLKSPRTAATAVISIVSDPHGKLARVQKSTY